MTRNRPIPLSPFASGIVVGSIVVALCAGAAAPPDPPEGSRPAKPAWRPTEFKARIAIGLVEPPTAQDYRWLVGIIKSDEIDADTLAARIDAMVADLSALHERRIAPLLVRSEEAAMVIGPPTVDQARKFATLLEDRGRAMAEWEARERELIRVLCEDLAIPAPQRSRAHRAHVLEIRRRVAAEIPCSLAPASVDLEEILRPIARQEGAVARPEELDAALSAWSDEIAALDSQRVHARMKSSAEDTVDIAEHQPLDAEFVARRRARFATGVRKERLIVDANGRWTGRIAECLSPAAGDAFARAVGATSYPSVHPNRFDLQPILAELSTMTDEKKRAALLTVIDALRQQAKEVDSDMERACLDSWTEWGLTYASRGNQTTQQAIAERLAPLDAKRRELAAQAIALLRSEGAIHELPKALAMEVALGDAAGSHEPERP
ncbi:MAG: hypothetical protein U0575_09305 [Phycisphaerales bacterium]